MQKIATNYHQFHEPPPVTTNYYHQVLFIYLFPLRFSVCFPYITDDCEFHKLYELLGDYDLAAAPRGRSCSAVWISNWYPHHRHLSSKTTTG